MTRMLGLLVFSSLLFAETPLTKAPLTEDDFKVSQAIETETAGPIYRLDLTEAIYQNAKHDDLRDLRVFNADGEIVPHSFALRTTEEVHSTSTQSLVFFPIEGAQGTSGADSEITLSEKGGRVVSVRLKGGKPSQKDVRIAYLVDLRKKDAALRSLSLDWASKRKNGIVSLNIEGSDDLKNWTHLASEVTLAKFAFQGENLEKNTIEIPDARVKYLKITWEDDPSFSITKLEGEFLAGGWVETKRFNNDVKSHRTEKAEFFYLKPPFMVDRVGVVFPEENTMVRVTISSNAKSDTDTNGWVRRFSGPAYRLRQEDGEVTSGVVKVSPTADRHWKLEVEGKEASLGKQEPLLRFAWVAHQVFFLARGKAPFRLAVGNSDAKHADFGFTSLVESLSPDSKTVQVKGAKLVGEFTTHAEKVVPPPPVELPWKKYALWASLAAALLLSSLMAYKLYSELGGKS